MVHQKKISKSLRNDLDPDTFFSGADPGFGSGSASKLDGFLALVLLFLFQFII